VATGITWEMWKRGGRRKQSAWQKVKRCLKKKRTREAVEARKKYPWGRWLAPGTTTLARGGVDFDCKPSSLVCQAYVRAAKLGLKITATEAGPDKADVKIVCREVEVKRTRGTTKKAKS
jgi:hypothetical protein